MSQELPHQRAILKFIAFAAAPGGLSYCAINISKGVYSLAAVELVYAVFAIFVVRHIDSIKQIRLLTSVIILPILLIISYAISLPTASTTMFIWALSIPAITYASMGCKTGFYITGIFYIYIGAVYGYRVQDSPGNLDANALLNVVICTFSLWSYAHIYENYRAKSYAKLERLASRDPLTGLYNRLRMSDIYSLESKSSKNAADRLGLIMIDLDHFKFINDTYGHDVGDIVLCEVAKALQHSVHSSDYVFRLGGEEFCIMLVNTNQQALVNIAEKLRAKIANLDVVAEGVKLPITASLGCTITQKTKQSDSDSLRALLQRADQFLYMAKNNGRNCVIH